MTALVKRSTWLLCITGVLMLPLAASAAEEHTCGTNTCSNCDRVNGQTMCFDKCNGSICRYEFCEICEP